MHGQAAPQVASNGYGAHGSWSATTGAPRAICPDLLSIRDIGEADGWRGRVVRGFFRLLKALTGV